MVIAPVIKVMSLLLAASFILAPTPQPQAGKITNKIEKTIIDKAKQNAPGAPAKKKLPITGGYKPGANPLPEGMTPHQNYTNAWNLLKKELGLQ